MPSKSFIDQLLLSPKPIQCTDFIHEPSEYRTYDDEKVLRMFDIRKKRVQERYKATKRISPHFETDIVGNRIEESGFLVKRKGKLL